jgi:TPR repeat protein
MRPALRLVFWLPLHLLCCAVLAGCSGKAPTERELLEKAAAQGDAAAQFSIGASCRENTGPQNSPSEAAAWYRKAADQGVIEAQHNLGSL